MISTSIDPDDTNRISKRLAERIFTAILSQQNASRMEVTVIGDAVNLAAKLEKHTKMEEVRALCTACAFETALHQACRPAGEGKKLVGRNIEGVEKPQDIVVIAK